MSDDTGGEGFARRTVRSVLWIGASQYLLFGLGIVKTGVLARLVDPLYFGTVAIAQAWVAYLLFFRFDFRPAILGWEKTPRLLNTHFWLDLIMAGSGFVLAGLVYLLFPNVLSPLIWAAIWLLLAITLFESLALTPRLLTERAMRQDVIAQLMIVASLLGLVVPILLAWRRLYLLAVVLDMMMPVLVLSAGLLIRQRWRPRLIFDRAVARRLLSFGLVLWTNGLLGKITFQFDDWLVGTYQNARPRVWMSAGIRPAAFYWRAYVAGRMPMDVFAGMIGSIALPLYTRSADRGPAVLKDVYRQLTWLLAYMIFFSSAVALVATEEVVTIVLGGGWLPTVPLFRLMSLFIIGRPLYQNANQLLLAIQREKDVRRTTAVQAIFLLVVCPPAVFFWGAAGAAVTVSIMIVLGVIAAERYVTRELGEAIWPVYVVPGVVGLLVCGMLFGINPWLPGNVWLSLTIKGLVCGVAFGGVAWLFEREQIRAVVAIVRRGLDTSPTATDTTE